MERTRFPIRSGAGKGLGAWGLLWLLEGFGEALQSQVVVPHLGEAFMLLVQADKVNVLVAGDGAAPLLHANVIVAVVKGAQVWFPSMNLSSKHISGSRMRSPFCSP